MKLLKPALIIVLILFASFLIYSVVASVSRTSVVRSPGVVDTPEEKEKAAMIQEKCFMEIEEITEKDASQFNEFRSLADFRLYKYRECLDREAE